MSRIYTIELRLSADEDYDVAEFLAMHCRSHWDFHSHCPTGDMNCPFCVDACKDITAEDWEPLLQNFHDIKTS
jgi:hypothetical protein